VSRVTKALLAVLLAYPFWNSAIWALESADPQGQNLSYFDIDALRNTINRQAPVNAVAFMADGKTVASGSDDSVIRLWNILTGMETQRLVGHSGRVLSIEISPDGSTLASGSDDRTVRLWDIKSGQEIHTFAVHADAASPISFSPDGKIFAWGTDNDTVRRWDVTAETELAPIKGLSGQIWSVAFSPDGTVLATGGEDKTVRLRNMKTGKEIRRLEGHDELVSSISFSPDGKFLATGSDDHTVRLWELKKGTGGILKEPRILKGHLSKVSSVHFSLDGATLASASYDHTVRIWDVNSGTTIQTFSGHLSKVLSVRYSPKGRILASGSFDGTVRLWDPSTGLELRSLEGGISKTLSIKFSPDGKLLASGAFDGSVRLWDPESGQEINTSEGHSEAVTSIGFSLDGKTLASGSFDHTISLWDVLKGKETKSLIGHSDWIFAVCFSPDGHTIASGSADRTVRLWNISSGKEIRSFKGHTDWVWSVDFSPDGSLIASGAADGTVRIWDVKTGKTAQRFKLSDEVRSIKFSPDGKILASGGEDGKIVLWDMDKGEQARVLEGNFPQIRSVSFSPNGEILAAGYTDKTVRIWNLSTGEEVQSIKGHSGSVLSLDFNPRGNILASSSYGITLYSASHSAFRFSSFFASNRKGYWLLCLSNNRCWHHDNGSFLSRLESNGKVFPILPQWAAQNTSLEVLQYTENLEVTDGEARDFQIRVRNIGKSEAHWINVVQKVKHDDRQENRFVFYPPKTIMSMHPGEEKTLRCRVSFLAEYHNPLRETGNLRLAVISPSTKPLDIQIPVKSRTASLFIHSIGFKSKSPAILRVPVENIGARNLYSTEFVLSVPGSKHILGSVIQDKILHDELINLDFSVSNTVEINEKTQFSLVARTRQHPFHTWEFHNQHLVAPSRSPLYLALLSITTIIFSVSIYYLHFYRNSLVVRLSMHPQDLLNQPVEALPKVKHLLRLTRRLDTVLFSNAIHEDWFDRAINFFKNTNDWQKSKWLAQRLGAQVISPSQHNTNNTVKSASMFTLRMPKNFMLNMQQCIFWFPSPDSSVQVIIAQLQQVEEARVYASVIFSIHLEQQKELRERVRDPTNMWVVPTSIEQTRLLLSPNPLAEFTRLLATQVSITRISPYQTHGGVNKDTFFFGREQILADIMRREPTSYLLVGGRQLGKTSLLKAIQRRYQEDPRVECHYISLGRKDIWPHLAHALKLPIDSDYSTILAYLGEVPTANYRLLLLDEADHFVHEEAARQYTTLHNFRSLSEEGSCHFILAGFWNLYESATFEHRAPIKNFGEVLRIGALEEKARYELATVPMQALSIRYESDDLVKKLLYETGGRANLIAILCDQILKSLAAHNRVIQENHLEFAFNSAEVRAAMAHWGSLGGVDEDANRLDRIIVYATVRERRFTLSALLRILEEIVCAYTYNNEQIKRSLARLELDFILGRSENEYFYRVPFFQKMIQEEDPELQLERECRQISYPSHSGVF
jgi:WD40 repeat protein